MKKETSWVNKKEKNIYTLIRVFPCILTSGSMDGKRFEYDTVDEMIADGWDNVEDLLNESLKKNAL